MLHTLLMVVHVICAVLIIGLVLIQRGKGADAGAGFGAGASGTVFGARGAGTALSRATAVLAATFMITSLALAYTGNVAAKGQGGSVLDQLSTTSLDSAPVTVPAAPAPAAPAVPVAPAN